jgi:hypothetical protein
MKDILKSDSIFKNPPKSVLMSDILIRVNEDLIGDFTFVLPDGKYDFIKGENFKLSEGYYIIFKNK